MKGLDVLKGVRIVEQGTFITGPCCGLMLADLGADVIKVEAPEGGDPIRQWRILKDGTSLWWSVQSRNKKSVSLDLRQPEARDIVRRLAAECDFPVQRLVLGGDHLGPNRWQSEPAAQAMAHAEDDLRHAAASTMVAARSRDGRQPSRCQASRS